MHCTGHKESSRTICMTNTQLRSLNRAEKKLGQVLGDGAFKIHWDSSPTAMVIFMGYIPTAQLGVTHGVMVSTCVFLACHQC